MPAAVRNKFGPSGKDVLFSAIWALMLKGIGDFDAFGGPILSFVGGGRRVFNPVFSYGPCLAEYIPQHLEHSRVCGTLTQAANMNTGGDDCAAQLVVRHFKLPDAFAWAH